MIELMITLAVAVVLASIAAPYFRDIILANQMVGSTNDLVQTFYAARIEAVKQTENISVSALNSGDASDEWGPGLRVWRDANGNSTYDDGEEIKILSAAQISQTIDSPDGTITFDFLPSGGINPAAMTFNICDNRSGEVGRSITINSQGQVRATEANCT